MLPGFAGIFCGTWHENDPNVENLLRIRPEADWDPLEMLWPNVNIRRRDPAGRQSLRVLWIPNGQIKIDKTNIFFWGGGYFSPLRQRRIGSDWNNLILMWRLGVVFRLNAHWFFCNLKFVFIEIWIFGEFCNLTMLRPVGGRTLSATLKELVFHFGEMNWKKKKWKANKLRIKGGLWKRNMQMWSDLADDYSLIVLVLQVGRFFWLIANGIIADVNGLNVARFRMNF